MILFVILIFSPVGFSFEILYERVGDDAVLPCNIDRSSEQFYDVKWLIDRPDSEEISCKESVVQSSAGASRLSVSRNCSLLIRNITDEDAEKYICRLGNKKWIDYIDVYVYLNVLSSEYSAMNTLTFGDFFYLNQNLKILQRMKNYSLIYIQSQNQFSSQMRGDICLYFTEAELLGFSNRIIGFVEDDKVKTYAVYVLDFSCKTVFILFIHKDKVVKVKVWVTWPILISQNIVNSLYFMLRLFLIFFEKE
uniref:Ig-like domain-containing protein n=1 Tax=Oryzias latipes TaxID=8090 RepID=A0A3B3IMG5_ORYLA